MWFGTRVFMQEVPDPTPDLEYPDTGWEASTQYENGGLGVSQSVSKHGEYLLTWDVMERAEVRKITDYADGVYGTGLIYWLDPVAIDQNVLPQSWAVPALAAEDAIPLVGDARPATTDNTNFSQGYPAKKAVYTVTDASVSRSIFIPIPTGYVAWVGVHGETSAQDFIKVTPYVGAVAGTPVYPTILGVATATRVNTEISAATGMELSVDVSEAGEGASFTVTGMIVQILPDGDTPETGGFISGQGHSGCRFMGRPVKTPYGTRNNLVGLSVKLGEVGEWL